jgi:hypothetical protein
MRIRYVFGKDKKLYREGEVPEEIGLLHESHTIARGPTIHMDYPDFVSPIDGTVVKGRRGLRDHCREHDVVPTADLKGLPFKQAAEPYTPDRAAIRQELKKQFYK